MKKLKKTPRFKSEAEEREFWKKNDSTEYVDWNNAERVTFPNLEPSTEDVKSQSQKY